VAGKQTFLEWNIQRKLRAFLDDFLYVKRIKGERMKNLVDLITDLILKYTPFKGKRTKSTSLITIIGAIALMATGGLEPEVGSGLIVVALGNLYAADHNK